jgi:proteasome lid subunit RPN8/RPN11
VSAPVEILVSVVAEIRAAAERAYPHEGCGALLGSSTGGVIEAWPLENREQDAPRTRFAVSPEDYMEVENRADARGLELLGFWHSHPDHPARPSETDRRFAWEGLLTVVVSVVRGRSDALTAWDVDGPGFRERSLFEKNPHKEA